MHPAMIVFLLVLLVLLLLGVTVLARSGWGGDGEGASARRTLIMGVAGLTAASLVFSVIALYVAQRGGGLADADGLNSLPDDARAQIEALQARVAALEARDASVAAPPTPGGFRLSPALKDVILRARPGGEALRRVPGGAGLQVEFCSSEREAGQYWCEIRLASGETGWVPRSLINPQPVEGGANRARGEGDRVN